MMIAVGYAHGLDDSTLLGGTGITAENLADEFAQFWADQEIHVARNLLGALGDKPGLGVETARHATLGKAGLAGLAALASATVGAVLNIAIRYQDLVPVAARYSLEEIGEEVLIVVDGQAVPEDVRSYFVERDVMLIFIAGEVLGVDIPVLEIGFRESAERVAELTSVPPFDRCPVLSGQVRNSIAVPREFLQQPMPQADPHTAAMVERQLGETLRQLVGTGRGLTSAVCDRLLRDSGMVPTMAEVAGELHITVRTLRRQLAAEGSTFRGLLNNVRESRAAELLRGGSTVEEVARLLGYAETANFTHAFTRWRGMSPRAFRQSLTRRR
ncbi:helix-turn-helix transcriptional regulator [Nocardia miyunensis]|uniref:helix-turn-helix transcriptional regulator n=1 Tax=Nocardia miyunensis TaxID=282684 RepID=UPI000A01E7C9|nr:AraC family transcriptional regulator [Nocardia miyunensis]